jgi:hypothetical protein
MEKQQKGHTRTKDSHKKWITLTYFGPGTRSISNLFRQENLQITYRTTGSIHNLLRGQTQHNDNMYGNSGIYSLKCVTCQLAYIGQIRCSLKLHYNEHIRFIQTKIRNQCTPNTYYNKGMSMVLYKKLCPYYTRSAKENARTL